MFLPENPRGYRSLADYSPGCRVGHDWATNHKHSTGKAIAPYLFQLAVHQELKPQPPPSNTQWTASAFSISFRMLLWGDNAFLQITTNERPDSLSVFFPFLIYYNQEVMFSFRIRYLSFCCWRLAESKLSLIFTLLLWPELRWPDFWGLTPLSLLGSILIWLKRIKHNSCHQMAWVV